MSISDVYLEELIYQLWISELNMIYTALQLLIS